MPLAIPVVWSDSHRLHEPGGEVWVGVRIAGTEVPERAERIRAALERAGATFVAARPQPDDALLAVHDPDLLAYLAEAWASWEASGLADDPGQDRVVPYLFPHPALLGGLEPAVPSRGEREGGRLRLRHDDPDRPGDLGGGARRSRRRADRRRPRRRGRAGRLRLRAATRPPRDPERVRRLLLPQQRGARRLAAARRGRRAGRRDRPRRTPRQRHAGDLLRRPGGPDRLGARRPGRRLVPALPRLRRRDRRRGRGRVEPQPAARARVRRRALHRGGRRARRLGGGGGGPGRWSSRSGWTPRSATPRARWRSRPPACGRPASHSARSGYRPWPSRRADTTSTRWAGW